MNHDEYKAAIKAMAEAQVHDLIEQLDDLPFDEVKGILQERETYDVYVEDLMEATGHIINAKDAVKFATEMGENYEYEGCGKASLSDLVIYVHTWCDTYDVTDSDPFWEAVAKEFGVTVE
jgi:hypothetical protein